ncbi:hypothetical protein [Aeromonas sp. QDB07]|uniref:hypothetical protein n=1 Tax=Aeromonas sp. QDB07 TaxID=2989838 RepID=UPI0022E8ABE6|nr:hypothetical protein [Aeromonas sp. QDB07]
MMATLRVLLLSAPLVAVGNGGPVEGMKACTPLTTAESMDDIQERLGLELMSQGDTLTGHTAISDAASGREADIESITETAVSQYQPGQRPKFKQVEMQGEKWLCAY